MTSTDDLKARICRIAANVLRLDPSFLRTDDNLFEQGLDSIITIQLVVRLRKELGVRITPVDIFKHQTIESLAQLCAEKLKLSPPINEQTTEHVRTERE